ARERREQRPRAWPGRAGERASADVVEVEAQAGQEIGSQPWPRREQDEERERRSRGQRRPRAGTERRQRRARGDPENGERERQEQDVRLSAEREPRRQARAEERRRAGAYDAVPGEQQRRGHEHRAARVLEVEPQG